MLDPEKIALNGSEDAIQTALMCWCSFNLEKYPELRLLHHSPNGGLRSKREAAKFKAMGVKAGFPDLFLPVARKGYHGLFIEMKKSGGRVSQNQMAYLDSLNDQGYVIRVCYSWETAKDDLIFYLT